MHDISDHLYNTLLRLPKQELLETLLDALEHMQSYNGRSLTACIMESAGATESEGGCRWEFPERWRNAINAEQATTPAPAGQQPAEAG